MYLKGFSLKSSTIFYCALIEKSILINRQTKTRRMDLSAAAAGGRHVIVASRPGLG